MRVVGEFPVIDVGVGYNVEVYRGEHRHKHEHGPNVNHEQPPETPLRVTGRVEQCTQTLEE